MKRFFSRFSGGSTANPPTLSPAHPFDQTWEKKDLPSDFAPHTATGNASHSSSRSTEQRVKALAAKYEGSQQQQQRQQQTTRSGGADVYKALPQPPSLDRRLSFSMAASSEDPAVASFSPSLAAAPAAQPSTGIVAAAAPLAFESTSRGRLDGLGLAPPVNPHELVTATATANEQRPPPQKAPPKRTSSGGPSGGGRPHTPTLRGHDSETRQKHADQRQPSGSSQGSGGMASASAHSAVGTKSVAFAPSPEKPSQQSSQHGHRHSHGNGHSLLRSASPGITPPSAAAAAAAFTSTAASATAAGGSRPLTLSMPADSGFTSNFARPTVASQARARSSGRLSGSEGLGWTGGGGGSGGVAMGNATSPTGERPQNLSIAPRPVKMSRTNSLQSSSRRQGNIGGGSSHAAAAAASGDADGTPLAISSPSMIAPTLIGSPASASTSNLGHRHHPHHHHHNHHPGGSPHAPRASNDANSIPFASLGPPQVASQPAVRSSSPVSFGTPTSTPMQITGSAESSSGHAGWRPAADSSRRGSFAPSSMGSWRESHRFPFGSIGARQSGVPSWSEMTQEDLVHNLGPRERTRQEVLWEIVASEERYVAELEMVKELYVDALLRPDQFDPDRLLGRKQAAASSLSAGGPQVDAGSPQIEASFTGSLGPRASRREAIVPSEAATCFGAFNAAGQDLPIAARFMSATASTLRGGEEDATGSASGHGSSLHRIDSAAQAQVEGQIAVGTRSPYSVGLLNAASTASASSPSQQQQRPSDSRRNSLTGQGSGGRKALSAGPHGASSRSSLAHGLGLGIGPSRAGVAAPLSSRHPVGAAAADAPTGRPAKQSRQSLALSKVQKLRERSRAAGEGDPMVLAVPLPRSLRAVLESVSEGMVESHALLSDALKARYEEQWPLVRSLADVFMRYSYILKHYAAYVCHLQRALEELEEAALMERAMRGKRIKKERLSHTVGLGRTISALEATALDRGHGGLSIFVSMPFQRLLKYPLLFQNLLFHTDPSTHEFESTVAMVVEVERLVRSIEDEKVNAEERDKTRDAFARIEGLTDRQVLRPRPDRTLIEEKAMYDESQRRAVSESTPKEPLLSSSLAAANAAAATTDASDHEGVAGGETPTKALLKGGGGGSGSTSRWSTSPGLRAALRNKRSYRRLSDFLSTEDKGGSSSTKAPSMGSKKDLWLVRFSDVEIKCQRIGVTALPMVSSAALTFEGVGIGNGGGGSSAATIAAQGAEESAEMDFARRSKESKERLKALRSTTLRAKTRNIYRFVSVVAWRTAAAKQMGAEGQTGAEDGGVDGLPTSHEVVEEEDEADAFTGDSDSASSGGRSSDSTSSGDEGDAGYVTPDRYIRQSKLSFSYWGDKVEPRIAGRSGAGSASGGSPLINASSVAAYRSATGAHGNGTRSSSSLGLGVGAGSSGRKSQANGGNKGGAVTHGSRPISSGSVGMSATGAPLRRPASPSKRSSLGSPAMSGGGMSSRLAEPLAASSMNSAPEAVQSAVARMHAKRRSDKFGGRMRGLTAPTHHGNTATAAAAAATTPSPDSSVSVDDTASTTAAAAGA